MARGRHLLVDTSAALSGRSLLSSGVRGAPSVLAGRHPVFPASEVSSSAPCPAQRKPGVTRGGADLGARHQPLWIPTDCVLGVLLAVKDQI